MTASKFTLPDEDWYSSQSTKRGVSNHCSIAANDKCPRYFVSQTNAALLGAASQELSPEVALRLNTQWETSDVFSSMDLTVGTWVTKKSGSLRGVSNFCPEVTARIFGLFCSDLRSYPDDDARIEAHQILEKENVAKDDHRWTWMVIEPKHFCECHEFAVYGWPINRNSKQTKTKLRIGSLGPKLRFKVFSNDNFRCVYCGVTARDSELEVDHKLPVAAGGTDDISNLVTACAKCNSGKGARPLSDA
ncbi:MAG: HNH endonuclease [Polaromonas sp.]|uniref:HNH endonuclease n=1 Tax=Polaromonas sp. TaxID=1869339 RepID=UPI002735F434|nr:HNH endonuclease [Polaromonas sp.]MDP2819540.1 HNH endonuclease [Polaromonas sp.]